MSKQNIKNIVILIVAIIGATCFNLNLDTSVSIRDAFTSADAILLMSFFLILFIALKQIVELKDKRARIISVIVAAIFAAMEVVGYSISSYNSLAGIIGSKEIFLKAVLKFIGYAIVFYTIIIYVYTKVLPRIKLKEDREKLFSSEYKEKMAAYADEGLFLYYLETPDLPILDKDIQAKDIIDAFLYSDCEGLNELFSSLLDMNNPGISMIRKQEDIRATIELIRCGYYRSAVRNLFALLDSEHKKAANTYEGIITKRKQYKKGHQRAQKIDELIDNTDDPWIVVAWNKIDSYYKKVVATDPVKRVIHRNSIVHGDYDSNLIDIDKYSATMLLLLYLNLRIIADYLCNKEEIFEEVLLYLPSIILMLKEKPSDN